MPHQCDLRSIRWKALGQPGLGVSPIRFSVYESGSRSRSKKRVYSLNQLQWKSCAVGEFGRARISPPSGRTVSRYLRRDGGRAQR